MTWSPDHPATRLLSEDQQQRIRVLTNGSIAYDKVACAIRELFGDAVDESQAVKGKTYWQADGWDDGDYEDGAADFLHDEPLSTVMEELDAIEFAGDFLSHVFYESNQRLSSGKGKGKGKGKFASRKGKGGGKPWRLVDEDQKVFGVYGSYLDHRKALQESRTGSRRLL